MSNCIYPTCSDEKLPDVDFTKCPDCNNLVNPKLNTFDRKDLNAMIFQHNGCTFDHLNLIETATTEFIKCPECKIEFHVKDKQLPVVLIPTDTKNEQEIKKGDKYMNQFQKWIGIVSQVSNDVVTIIPDDSSELQWVKLESFKRNFVKV